MKRFRPFFMAAAMVMMISVLLVGCSGSGESQKSTLTATSTKISLSHTADGANQDKATKAANPGAASEQDGGTWAIYMYVCGSDLESEWGCASDNLLDLMNAQRTEDTVIVAQTGGAAKWQNNFVDANKTQRWLFTDGDMELVDEQNRENMGKTETLAEFLQFASTHYPADHTMVLFWNHGGGTLEGCCMDENFKNDALSLSEMHAAFAQAYSLSKEKPPIDILGFDCCLMATLDVADTFQDTAHYLLASEETEPGIGWNYQQIGNSLGKNPGMSAYELGKVICDSYYKGLQEQEQEDTATLSLTDLSRVGKLKEAFSQFADEMIITAYHDPDYFREYALFAKSTENYGGNSRAEGYSDLIDIQHFVQNAEGYIDGADRVLQAMKECVVYKVNGAYRTEGGGLSFYYDYDGWDEKNDDYIQNGTIDSLKVLYPLGVSGKLDEAGNKYIKKLGLNPGSLPTIKTFENYDFNGQPVEFSPEGTAFADFGSDVSTCIIDAMYNIYYVQDDEVYFIGSDDEVNADYTTGVVEEDMGGQWGYFGGNLAFMELTYDSDDYNMYSVPIRIDGEDMFLQVVFDFHSRSWEVLGARAPGSATALTSRAEYIEDGTEVTLIQYQWGENGEMIPVEGGTFIYDADTSFAYDALEDGFYAIEFVIEDIFTNTATSDFAFFEINNGVKTYLD